MAFMIDMNDHLCDTVQSLLRARPLGELSTLAM